jgi:hypothetical protein
MIGIWCLDCKNTSLITNDEIIFFFKKKKDSKSTKIKKQIIIWMLRIKTREVQVRGPRHF